MAKKFVLVPEDMYHEMLSRSDTEPLTNAKRELTSVLHSKMDAGQKKLLYNNKLQNYIRLRREAQEKPVKVELVREEKLPVEEEVPVEQPATPARPNRRYSYFSTPQSSPSVAVDAVERVINLIYDNEEQLRVRDDRIIGDGGNPIRNSNLESTVQWLLSRRTTDAPPGTSTLLKRLKAFPNILNMFPQRGTGIVKPISVSKRSFKPDLWTF